MTICLGATGDRYKLEHGVDEYLGRDETFTFIPTKQERESLTPSPFTLDHARGGMACGDEKVTVTGVEDVAEAARLASECIAEIDPVITRLSAFRK